MILTIIPRAPFDFDLSSRIFSTGDRQIRKYENGEYWQVIRVGSKLFLAVIRPEGTVDNPKLRVELRSKGKISSHDNEAAKEIITSLFNLDFDLNPFYRDVKMTWSCSICPSGSGV